jgi:hypothetical protein
MYNSVHLGSFHVSRFAGLPYLPMIWRSWDHTTELNIYRGPSFLVVARFGFYPIPYPLSPQQVVSLLLSLLVCRRPRLSTGGGGGGGAKSYYNKKAWSSINHSILSVSPFRFCSKLNISWKKGRCKQVTQGQMANDSYLYLQRNNAYFM